MVGAIGLQGIRLIEPTFGETVVVLGLGLIGLISAQILKANGCTVIGLDLDEDKVQKARELGIDAINSGQQDPVKYVEEQTGKVGADAVLITASTKSDAVIKQAANMSRKRGRIVLVGVVGLDIDRSDFYEKELSFQVSCSYGPGRYDDEYEQKGHDYPLPYVRWTEKRNFEAVLRAMAEGQLEVEPLITERVPLGEYQQIYGDMEGSDSIASLLEYPVTTKGTKDTKGLTALTTKGTKDTKERLDGRTISVSGASFEGGVV
ncbi:MAG: zinc-binding alcohol dehydrogenase [Balneolaceae bacterium]|nr:zinc-binding alcohol dehydrogenase [Balneolaceae bacterium]